MFLNFQSAIQEMDRVRNELDRLFEAPRYFEHDAPVLSLVENQEGIQIRVEVPGMDKESLDLRFNQGILTIKGEFPKPELPEGAELLRQERQEGPFEKNIRLRNDIDPEGVNATLNEGILTIDLPIAEAAKPRQIAIN